MTDAPLTSVESRLRAVRLEIEQAALRADRDPLAVTLVAVSKGFPIESIRQAYAAGQRDFGENRVQELLAKHAYLRGAGAAWHFIGRLQRNKLAKLARLAPVIHSVDSRSMAAELSSRAAMPLRILLEVNVTEEPNKAGLAPREVPGIVDDVLDMPNLELVGLMTMAPRLEDPEGARPAFRRLAELRDQLSKRYSSGRIHHLSMGMSQDYRIAVEEGSTLVRVGEAIFGKRLQLGVSPGIEEEGTQKR
ncbi:MAG: YggS family pyridoxal phosphate-dependent enzyme [Actinomycetota bacterium]